MQSLVAF